MNTRICALLTAMAAGSLSRAATYQHDDGSAESGVVMAFYGGVYVNYTVDAGQNQLLGLEAFVIGGVKTVTISAWSDPNQDGNPGDAVLLGTASGVVAGGGGTWNSISFDNAIDLGPNGNSFFIGIYWGGPQIQLGVDTTYSGPNVGWTISGFVAQQPTILNGAASRTGAPMLRANAVPAPSGVLLLGVSGLAARRRR